MSDSQLAVKLRTFSFDVQNPEMLMDVEALDLLAIETQAVVSSSAKLGGSIFSTLTSLSRHALSLDI
eukprot:7999231-Ditylum_brightwellii.AAC.1